MSDIKWTAGRNQHLGKYSFPGAEIDKFLLYVCKYVQNRNTAPESGNLLLKEKQKDILAV